MSNAKRVRPFLKWAGGKYRLLDAIEQHLPPGGRLVEPFVGSGALFVNGHFNSYQLCDSNPDLIELYRHLKREGERFIRDCSRLFAAEYNSGEAYYRLREEFNASDDKRRRSQLFLYLNRHGYNGLCRYNSRHAFNVPFGHYKRPYFPAKEMQHFHQHAHRARFAVRDFSSTLKGCRPGDVVYCDPPYVPLSHSSSFTNYSGDGFLPRQQEQLAQLARACAAKGVSVLISNHDTPYTRTLYADAEITHLNVRRNISCKIEERVEVGELLALFRASGG